MPRRPRRLLRARVLAPWRREDAQPILPEQPARKGSRDQMAEKIHRTAARDCGAHHRASASATYPGTNGEIAYARYGGKRVPSTLRTIEPNGDPGRTLARPGVGLPDAEWSPDGTRVAMVLGKEPNRVVMLDVATGERSLVIRSDDVPDTRLVDSLGISPDGDAIVFCAIRRGSGTTLFTIGTDGTALTDISGDHDECQPDWGPTDRIAAEATGWMGRIVTMARRLQPALRDPGSRRGSGDLLLRPELVA